MIERTIQQFQTEVKNTNSMIKVRRLCKIKKDIKNQLQMTQDKKEQEILIATNNLIIEHIDFQREKAKANRTNKKLQQLKKKMVHGPNIWEIKRKVTRATDTLHTLKNPNGELMESMQDTLGAY